jgi:hypothetical protein
MSVADDQNVQIAAIVLRAALQFPPIGPDARLTPCGASLPASPHLITADGSGTRRRSAIALAAGAPRRPLTSLLVLKRQMPGLRQLSGVEQRLGPKMGQIRMNRTPSPPGLHRTIADPAGCWWLAKRVGGVLKTMRAAQPKGASGEPRALRAGRRARLAPMDREHGEPRLGERPFPARPDTRCRYLSKPPRAMATERPRRQGTATATGGRLVGAGWLRQPTRSRGGGSARYPPEFIAWAGAR